MQPEMSSGRAIVTHSKSDVSGWVSDHARNFIWQEFLDVARCTRYYDALAQRYRQYTVIVRFALSLASTGALIGLLNVVPTPVSLVATAMIGALAILDLIWNPGEKANLLTAASHSLASMETEYRSLWENVQAERISDADAERLLRAFRAMFRSATSNISVGTDARLNERCAEDTYAAEVARYAPH